MQTSAGRPPPPCKQVQGDPPHLANECRATQRSFGEASSMHSVSLLISIAARESMALILWPVLRSGANWLRAWRAAAMAWRRHFESDKSLRVGEKVQAIKAL